MIRTLESAMDTLTDAQRDACNWNSGSLLVLAGPGSGKTHVLTTRIARLLRDTPNDLFRILALTFTNRAADEMRRRVNELMPVETDRLFIGTIHSFCAQRLRQHGSHIGISPDYGIYADDKDRQDLLRDALRNARRDGLPVSEDDVSMLRAIDLSRLQLKEITPIPPGSASMGAYDKFEVVYHLYETALKESNVLDFQALIYKTWELARRNASFRARIRRTYKYWLVDEFQDMSRSQYSILRTIADGKFRNLFAVADEDQLIYTWRGASREGINEFRDDFAAETIYFQENHRCPSDVVAAANRLISYNSMRDQGRPLSVPKQSAQSRSIRVLRFSDQYGEALAVAEYFKNLRPSQREQGGVLGRSYKILDDVLEGFNQRGVSGVIVRQRGQFASAQFRWLVSCLDLSVRPRDKQRLRHVAAEAGRISSALELDPDMLLEESEVSLEGYLEVWTRRARKVRDPIAQELVKFGRDLVESRGDWLQIVGNCVEFLRTTQVSKEGVVGDVEEDWQSWRDDSEHVFAEHGRSIELARFMQSMNLRTRIQRVVPGAVRLSTIHSAKGLQFDRVWVVGLAESVIPSFHAVKSGRIQDIEEERRSLYVAVTRTKSELTLSYPSIQHGWQRRQSRFLSEMFGGH